MVGKLLLWNQGDNISKSYMTVKILFRLDFIIRNLRHWKCFDSHPLRKKQASKQASKQTLGHMHTHRAVS